MGKKITIRIGEVEAQAELNDSPSAQRISGLLPLESNANTWGDEVYFNVPLDSDLDEQARDVMDVGELAYWPPGKAFCIFYGKTPASGLDTRPRAASEVNPIGRVLCNPSVFRSVRDGDRIIIEGEPTA